MKEGLTTLSRETRLGFFGAPDLINMGLDHCAPVTPPAMPWRLGVSKERPVLAITRLDGSAVLTIFANPETGERRLVPETLRV